MNRMKEQLCDCRSGDIELCDDFDRGIYSMTTCPRCLGKTLVQDPVEQAIDRTQRAQEALKKAIEAFEEAYERVQ